MKCGRCKREAIVNKNIDIWICDSCGAENPNKTIIASTGKKDDQDKLMWSLLPLGPMKDVVRAFMNGLTKYKRDDWQNVEDAKNRYYDAAFRHLTAWKEGKKKDKDSKLPSLAHAIASILIVMWHDIKRRK